MTAVLTAFEKEFGTAGSVSAEDVQALSTSFEEDLVSLAAPSSEVVDSAVLVTLRL